MGPTTPTKRWIRTNIHKTPPTRNTILRLEKTFKIEEPRMTVGEAVDRELPVEE